MSHFLSVFVPVGLWLIVFLPLTHRERQRLDSPFFLVNPDANTVVYYFLGFCIKIGVYF